jgi:hypothetical protein
VRTGASTLYSGFGQSYILQSLNKYMGKNNIYDTKCILYEKIMMILRKLILYYIFVDIFSL